MKIQCCVQAREFLQLLVRMLGKGSFSAEFVQDYGTLQNLSAFSLLLNINFPLDTCQIKL